MSTRSALFIQNDDSTWNEIYCHYDGYPAHMMPALANADPDAILAAQEIRQIQDDGQVQAFPTPRRAEQTRTPTIPDWAEYAYILTAAGWKAARTDAEAAQAAAA